MHTPLWDALLVFALHLTAPCLLTCVSLPFSAEERREAAGQAEGGGEGQKAGMDAFMEMGKLNTARIKKVRAGKEEREGARSSALSVQYQGHGKGVPVHVLLNLGLAVQGMQTVRIKFPCIYRPYCSLCQYFVHCHQ